MERHVGWAFPVADNIAPTSISEEVIDLLLAVGEQESRMAVVALPNLHVSQHIGSMTVAYNSEEGRVWRFETSFATGFAGV